MSTSEDEVLKSKCNVDRECQYKYTHALMVICLLAISCASLYKYQLSSKIIANEENLQITTRKQNAHLLFDQFSLPLMKHDPAMSTSEDEVLKSKCNLDRQCQYKYTPALMTICLVTISCASLYKYQLSFKITANEENLQITTRKQDAHLLLDQLSLPLMMHDHAISTSEDEVLKSKCNVDRQCRLSEISNNGLTEPIQLSNQSGVRIESFENDFGPNCMEVTETKHMDEN